MKRGSFTDMGHTKIEIIFLILIRIGYWLHKHDACPKLQRSSYVLRTDGQPSVYSQGIRV